MKIGETKQETIGANEFFIRPIPPTKAIGLLGEIQKLVGPAIGKGLASFTGGIKGDEKEAGFGLLNRKIDGEMLAGAFEALAMHVDGPKLQALVLKILDPQQIAVQTPEDSEPDRLTEAKLNEVFLGCPGNMFILIGKVLEVTYGDFFGKLTGLTGKLVGVAQK